MLARSHAYALVGLEAIAVDVDADMANGLPQMALVGLADQSVREAKERVRTAILNSQLELPPKKIVINLAPADIKKEGGAFDLPIALALLAASGQLDPAAVDQVAAIGELGLDGRVRPTPGILPTAMAAKSDGHQGLLVPAANAAEAAAVEGLCVIGVSSLAHAVAHLSGAEPVAPHPAHRPAATDEPDADALDFADVRGQALAKRALEVAVAGGHHVLMIGPPGSGKSMLAQRVPGLLPTLSLQEALESTRIHSVMGLISSTQPLLRRRPFRAPHHTSSAAALIGGGPVPRPGEISLAHHGVLFLDELPEFHRDALESLRQPLEEGTVRVSRSKRIASFPSRFMLIAAMNPCPCGYLTDPRRRCRCLLPNVHRYVGKISGPLLDRIDVHIDVPAVSAASLAQEHASEEPTDAIRQRIDAARRRQLERAGTLNAQLRHRQIRNICALSQEARALLIKAMEELRLSARAHDKILKVSRTIADLAASELIESEHVAEAVQYRSLDRRLWS